MRLRRIALPVVAAALTLAAVAPTAAASRADRKALWGPITIGQSAQFRLYQNMGAGILQMGLTWPSVAPTRPLQPTNPNDPAYHWDPTTDYAVNQASTYGMRILLQVNRAPMWANGGRHTNNPIVRPSDLANFMTAAAHHYPGVHLWMIFGEPNRRDNWSSIVSASRNATRLTKAQAAAPRLYARLVDASYGALKNVSKSNLVIAGDTYTFGYISTRMWIKYMRLPNGKPPRMDLYGHDPFTLRDPNLRSPQNDPRNRTYSWEWDFSDLGRLNQLVNSQLAPRHHHIKLFISEWCIPTGHDVEFNFYTTPAVQARWIRDAWRIVRRHSFIYALGWIHVADGAGSQSGLLYANGAHKPGYSAWVAG